MKSILEELEGLEIPGAGRRIFGWGLTGVVLGLGVAAVALVLESYFAGPEPAGPEGDDREARKGRKDAAKSSRSAESAAFEEYLAGLEGPLLDLAVALDAALLNLGDDTERAVLRRYVAYKKGGANYACAAVRRTSDEILVYLRLDPAGEELLPFMRDVTDVGHIGTGDLELRLTDLSELEASVEYLARSYAGV